MDRTAEEVRQGLKRMLRDMSPETEGDESFLPPPSPPSLDQAEREGHDALAKGEENLRHSSSSSLPLIIGETFPKRSKTASSGSSSVFGGHSMYPFVVQLAGYFHAKDPLELVDLDQIPGGPADQAVQARRKDLEQRRDELFLEQQAIIDLQRAQTDKLAAALERLKILRSGDDVARQAKALVETYDFLNHRVAEVQAKFEPLTLLRGIRDIFAYFKGDTNTTTNKIATAIAEGNQTITARDVWEKAVDTAGLMKEFQSERKLRAFDPSNESMKDAKMVEAVTLMLKYLAWHMIYNYRVFLGEDDSSAFVPFDSNWFSDKGPTLDEILAKDQQNSDPGVLYTPESGNVEFFPDTDPVSVTKSFGDIDQVARVRKGAALQPQPAFLKWLFQTRLVSAWELLSTTEDRPVNLRRQIDLIEVQAKDLTQGDSTKAQVSAWVTNLAKGSASVHPYLDSWRAWLDTRRETVEGPLSSEIALLSMQTTETARRYAERVKDIEKAESELRSIQQSVQASLSSEEDIPLTPEADAAVSSAMSTIRQVLPQFRYRTSGDFIRADKEVRALFAGIAAGILYKEIETLPHPDRWRPVRQAELTEANIAAKISMLDDYTWTGSGFQFKGGTFPY